MKDHEIFEKLRDYFEENYEYMRMDWGHAVTEDIKQLALTQILYYFVKMRDVAERVTDTEVKITLPEQTTPKGRDFTIEGVVDIVRDAEETWMYDIKTHDGDYIVSNKSLYEKQLNLYAHVWQELRGQPLDKTAIISTAIPDALRTAHFLNDQFAIQYELSKWQPLIDLDFKQEKVDEVVEDFANIVDRIEDKNFKPPCKSVLKSKMEGTNSIFATRICRNCDARYSCVSYRSYAMGSKKGKRGYFKRYLEDYGTDLENEDRINSNLDVMNIDEVTL